MERWLVRQGNPRLKLGEVKEKDADLITADVVTKDNSLVDRFIVDRHTASFARTTAKSKFMFDGSGPRGCCRAARLHFHFPFLAFFALGMTLRLGTPSPSR